MNKQIEINRLLTTTEAAELLYIKEQTLRKWRCTGQGPVSVSIGGAVRYRVTDLEAFIEAGASSCSSY